MGEKDTTAREGKEVDETMIGRGEAELAAEPTHDNTTSMRKYGSSSEGALPLHTERGEPTDGGNDEGGGDPRHQSSPREEKEGQQTF